MVHKDSLLYESSDQEKVNNEVYVLSGYRYVVGIVYALAAIQNILMWLIFAPIQSNLITIYNESNTYINFGTILISNVSYIPANFVASYILDTFGLRIGITLGSFLTTLGLWFRYVNVDTFTFIFIGQCFAGIAQPFFYSTPQKISNVWFGAKERAFATTVIATSLNIGNALGAFLPQFFVDIKETDRDTFLAQLKNMMLWTALAGSAVFVLTLILFREKPASAPSRGASATKHNYWESMKVLAKDWNAMLFLISSAAVGGGMVIYGSIIQQMVSPYNIDGDHVGNIVFIGIIIGFFGAGIGGAYISKTKKYKFAIIFMSVSSLLVLVGNYFAATSQNPYIFGVAFCAYFFIMTPVMPLSLEFGVELSFPVAESTSGGIWFVFNQLISTGGALAIDQVLGDTPNNTQASWGFFIIVIYQLVSLLPLFFIKENLKREKYEGSESINHEEKKSRSSSKKAVMRSMGGASLLYEDDYTQ